MFISNSKISLNKFSEIYLSNDNLPLVLIKDKLSYLNKYINEYEVLIQDLIKDR